MSLTDALAAEHAAIWGYGVVGAHLTGAAVDQARQCEAAHRDRRDVLLEQLSAGGATPPAAAPAYDLPFPVVDQASALEAGGRYRGPDRRRLARHPARPVRGRPAQSAVRAHRLRTARGPVAAYRRAEPGDRGAARYGQLTWAGWPLGSPTLGFT